MVNSHFGLQGAVNTSTVAYCVLLLTLVIAVTCSQAERLARPPSAAV